MRLLLTGLAVVASAFLLSPAAVAHGANVASPKMVAVASWAAGKPLEVHCEGDWAEWERMVAAAGFDDVVAGYTFLAQPRIYLAPSVCRNFEHGPYQPYFGHGLHVLLHEAFHQRWLSRDEARVDCGARVMLPETLRKWFNIPFFSDLSMAIVAETLAWTMRAPAEYQNGCYNL